ncbi:MAG: TlpA family protein disulfide reductase [Bryobacteraceae bacterium]
MKFAAPLALICSLSLPLLLSAAPQIPRKAVELAFNVPGHGQDLLSSHRGKVVALAFIETTCPHCQHWTGIFKKFQSVYGPHGFQVLEVAVNALDDGGSKQGANKVVTDFARQFGVNFPVGWVSKPQMASFMGYSQSRFVVPQLVLIDRSGVIREQTDQLGNGNYTQVMNEQNLEQEIAKLLAQRSE